MRSGKTEETMFNYHHLKIIEFIFIDKNFIVLIKSTLKFYAIIFPHFKNSPKFSTSNLLYELSLMLPGVDGRLYKYLWYAIDTRRKKQAAE